MIWYQQMTLLGGLELFFLSIYAPLWPKNPNVSVWHQYQKHQFLRPMRNNKLTPPLFLHRGVKTLTKNTIWVALGKKQKQKYQILTTVQLSGDLPTDPLPRVVALSETGYHEPRYQPGASFPPLTVTLLSLPGGTLKWLKFTGPY